LAGDLSRTLFLGYGFYIVKKDLILGGSLMTYDVAVIGAGV
jgi:hypothetical protein